MKHNIIHFYASNNFDKNELDAIREAKKKAISEKARTIGNNRIQARDIIQSLSDRIIL